MAGSKFGFANASAAFKQSTKQAAIEIMQASKKYFGEAFDKEQLGPDKWAEVARRTPGNLYNKRRVVHGVDQGDDYQTRKILRGTSGKLRYKTIKADSSITNFGAVSTMTNPTPYAAFMNDGTGKVPARPFMKQTDELTKIQLQILKDNTGKIWTVQP
jgi:phage gpG-like protein